MEGLRVDLKTFLCLAMPNQYCQTIKKEYEAGFWVIYLGWKLQTSMIPNIQLLPYCKMILTEPKHDQMQINTLKIIIFLQTYSALFNHKLVTCMSFFLQLGILVFTPENRSPLISKISIVMFSFMHLLPQLFVY